MASAPNPSGLCRCGCGAETRRATVTNPAYGHVKGEHVRYVKGHHMRKSGPTYVVDPVSGCWAWQLHRAPNGYGSLTVDGRQVSAHRHFYVQAKGPIPDGLQLDHLCRNRACVNPDHLEAVVPRTNVNRGLATKLSDEAVREIRDTPKGPKYAKHLAEQFGVSKTHIFAIRQGVKRAEVADAAHAR